MSTLGWMGLNSTALASGALKVLDSSLGVLSGPLRMDLRPEDPVVMGHAGSTALAAGESNVATAAMTGMHDVATNEVRPEAVRVAWGPPTTGGPSPYDAALPLA